MNPAMNGTAQAARPSGRALWALVAGALVLGATPILVRLTQTGPAAAGFWRLAFAMPLLMILAARGGHAPLGRGSPIVLAAGLFFALDLACWHYGIRFTSVANATVLPNLTPVLVAAAGWVFLRERPSRRFLVGMAGGVCGAAVMALANTGRAGPGGHRHLGDALSAATAVWYGLYFLCVRRARSRHSTLHVMAWSSLVGAPILLILALALGERILPAAIWGWAALAGLGLAHVGGQGSIAWSLGRLRASTAALVVLIQPVAAAALAWMLFAEPLSALQAAGGALALAGVAFAQFSDRDEAPLAP
jgi:drug/metabolite transporter (DMT)-like permease